MPKSFLFTHKRYDYEDIPQDTRDGNRMADEELLGRSIKVEEMDDEEEDTSPLQNALNRKGISITKQNIKEIGRRNEFSRTMSQSESYTGSEEEYAEEIEAEYDLSVKKRVPSAINLNSLPKHHHPATPKKRRLIPSVPYASDETTTVSNFSQAYTNMREGESAPSQTNLNTSFKTLSVSPDKMSFSNYSTKNILHQHQSAMRFYHHQSFHPTNSNSSHQIQLISPPVGGTLPHCNPHQSSKSRSKDNLPKDGEYYHQFRAGATIASSASSSPLQFIIAAAEHEEAEEDEKVFMEGSRSGRSQTHTHDAADCQPRNYRSQIDEEEFAEEQPVNLSVKKVDLFNLTQLAEVSIAAAKRDMMIMSLRSSNVNNITSSPSSGSPLITNNCLKTGMITSTASSSIPTITPSKNHSRPAFKQNENISVEEKRRKNSANASLEVACCGGGVTASVEEMDSRTKNKTELKKIIMKKGRNHNSPLLVATSMAPDTEIEKSEQKPIQKGRSSSSSGISTGSSNSSTRHRCVECGKGFSTLSNLARHRQTHRSLSDASAVKKCPHCDKVYVSMPAFSMHLRTHNQGCKCPYCGKGFSRPWLLQGHIRTHTGEKPFKCGICNKAFADKSNLRAHTQTHSTEKPFVCARCGKPFALKSYLCKHIESSCMKSNKPSGPNVGSNGTTSSSTSSSPPSSPSSVTTQSSGGGGSSISNANNKKSHHRQKAINNSSSPVSFTASSTGVSNKKRGTPIMSATSASSKGNNATTTTSPPINCDIRSSPFAPVLKASSSTTTVIASSQNSSDSCSSSVSIPHTKKASSISGFSSHHNNHNSKTLKARGNYKSNKNNNGKSTKNERIVSASTFFVPALTQHHHNHQRNRPPSSNNTVGAATFVMELLNSSA